MVLHQQFWKTAKGSINICKVTEIHSHSKLTDSSQTGEQNTHYLFGGELWGADLRLSTDSLKT